MKTILLTFFGILAGTVCFSQNIMNKPISINQNQTKGVLDTETDSLSDSAILSIRKGIENHFTFIKDTANGVFFLDEIQDVTVVNENGMKPVQNPNPVKLQMGYYVLDTKAKQVRYFGEEKLNKMLSKPQNNSNSFMANQSSVVLITAKN